jgi:glyoxylase-like metal-dependent hydrolase (beta-lactamase superfamily II)
MRSICERLLVLPEETIVLPGHMQETTIGFEKQHNPFVLEWLRRGQDPAASWLRQ